MIKKVVHTAFALVLAASAVAQTGSDSLKTQQAADVAAALKSSTPPGSRSISPRKAAIRSAIIPGWGQVLVRRDLDASFFRKYYSIPIVYGAIGTTVGVFAYNLTWYRRTRFAYRVLATKDSSSFGKVHPKLQYYIQTGNATSLQFYCNEFRKNLDYSALFVILFWGLNVVHASVEAHLKTFDVSPDLSLRFRGGYSELAGTNGISFLICFK